MTGSIPPGVPVPFGTPPHLMSPTSRQAILAALREKAAAKTITKDELRWAMELTEPARDRVKRGGVMARGLDERETVSHGEVIHTRRGHQAPEEFERQMDKPVHGSTR